jgi:hypothetical protein
MSLLGLPAEWLNCWPSSSSDSPAVISFTRFGAYGPVRRNDNSRRDRAKLAYTQSLQLAPKAIILALHGQMASRWAEVLGRDRGACPICGDDRDVHRHAAWVLKL